MATKTPKQRPLTPDDLKSLVQGLGALVRESVREEVRDQLKPVLVELQQATSRLNALHGYVTRLDEFCSGMSKTVQDIMAVERQRMARERDLEHRKFLGAVDLARHPERPGVDPKALEQAQQVSTAFVNGHVAQLAAEEREAERARPVLPDNRAEGRPPLQPGETPAIIDSVTVHKP